MIHSIPYMQNAILYLRYSTPEQAEGQSEQRQIQGAQRWCKEHGERLVKIYKDLGISGGKNSDDRKGLSALLSDLTSGSIPKYLLIEDVDRLSRMLPLDSLNLISKILDYGVTIVSLRDSQTLTKDNWQSSQSFLILSLKTTLANEERQKRIFRGKQPAAHPWKWQLSSTSFGFAGQMPIPVAVTQLMRFRGRSLKSETSIPNWIAMAITQHWKASHICPLLVSMIRNSQRMMSQT